MTEELDTTRPTLRGALSALAWIAAFLYAFAIFLSTKRIFGFVPPTPPVAIGRVTVEGASKLREYLVAALFYVEVPLLAIAFRRWLAEIPRKLANSIDSSRARATASSIAIFWAPFLLAPFFYLTTGKEGWAIILPPALGTIGCAIALYVSSHRWTRELFADAPARAAHSLIVVEALSWIVFRYLATGKRIAHIPTLFLEAIFVPFLVTAFWAGVILICRMIAVSSGRSAATLVRSVAIGATPFLLLPYFALFFVDARIVIVVIVALTLVACTIALVRNIVFDVRRFVLFGAVPLLLFAIAYASSASLARWLDLFHLGESIGPANDYLHGKVPFRDVFVLHGMLEDGLLDAWLMNWFGRALIVPITRAAVLNALALPALWLLAVAAFDSIPLSAAVTALGLVTFVDNERALLEIVVATLVIAGLKRRGTSWFVAAGAVSALALFASFDIGVYCFAGTVLSLVGVGLIARGERTRSARPYIGFTVGYAVVFGAFAAYLSTRNAFGAFVETSFRTIPSIIDAVWSLPFPDLVSPFRDNLALTSIADFLLSEKVRFVLNPVVIAIALVLLVVRTIRRRTDAADVTLAALTLFALVTQRTALGRADFPHQYFAAFLVGPIVVELLRRGAIALRNAAVRSDAAQVLSIAIGGGVALLLAIVLWIPDLANDRLDDVVTYQPRVSRIGYRNRQLETLEQRAELVTSEIRRIVPGRRPIFDFSNQPAFYFLADRPNPTRFYQMPIASPASSQLEIIRDLQRSRPEIILRGSPQRFDEFDGLSNDLRVAAVAAYLDDNYRFDRSVRGIEIWRRVSAPQRAAASYLKAIRIPKQLEAAKYSRVIFPAVASVEGAASTSWRSDLIVMNPFDETLEMRARYSSVSSSVDRTLSIAPHTLARYEDAVATLFASPATSGSLRVDYRSDRRPVVSVRTYDAARPGKGSLDSGVTDASAASADEGANELIMVGGPSRGTNRVNVGVANVGEGSARFRIFATTATGDVVGLPVVAGVEETKSYLLVEATKAIGVPLNESTVYHVRMLEGKAIAWTSIVDAYTAEHDTIVGVPVKGQ